MFEVSHRLNKTALFGERELPEAVSQVWQVILHAPASSGLCRYVKEGKKQQPSVEKVIGSYAITAGLESGISIPWSLIQVYICGGLGE